LNISFGNDSVDINNEMTAGAKQVAEFNFAEGPSETLAQLLTNGLAFSNSGDNLTLDRTQSTANESISLTGSNDAIQLGTGNDSVTLGNNDTVSGLTGSMTITAGSNDIINSSTANDSITIAADSGNTVINENSTPDNSSVDTLNFGTGITANDLTLSGGTDLKISFGSSSVDINNEFASGYKQITEFNFADGSSESLTELLGLGMSLGMDDNDAKLDRSGSSVNESISVSADNDQLSTGSGNDTVTVSGTNDTIGIGGAATVTDTGSNNTIYGGSEALSATVGANDIVYSSESNDQLYVGSGTGTTNVYESSYFSNDAQDTINFGTGITANDLVLSGTTNDLAITFDDSNDAVDIIGEFAAGDKQVTQFTFADDSSESLSTLIAAGLTVSNSSDDQTIDRSLSTVNETINDSGFNDLIYQGTGNDTISLGGFNDTVYGSNGALAVNVGFNSTIYSSSAQDSFNVGLSTENTVIYETAPNSGTINDSVTFGTAISQDDLTVSSSSNDLLISVDSGLATVDIMGEFGAGNKQVTDFEFADGSSETLSALLSSGLSVTNSSDNAVIDQTQSSVNETISLSGANDVMTAGTGNDTVLLTGAHDTINLGSGISSVTSDGNSSFTQGSGASTIVAAANDTIVGGTGTLTVTAGVNDSITASQADDMFTVATGTGQTIINEVAPGTVGNSDILSFGAGITANDLVLTATNNGLVIGLGSGSDAVQIKNEFASGYKQISEFQFANGSTDTLSQLLASGLTYSNSANNVSVDQSESPAAENVTLTGTNDTVYTGSGNDTVTVGDNSVVHFGSGDATITAGANDTVYGGSGVLNATLGANDTVNASNGNDYFTIAPGVGNAVINETTPGAVGDNDTLYFTSAFNPNDAVFTEVGNDLHIDLGDGNDYVTVVGQFATGNKQVATFNFADPLVASLSQLESEGVIQNSTPSPASTSNTSTSSNASSTDSSSSTTNSNPATTGNDVLNTNSHSNSSFDFDSFQKEYNSRYAKDFGPLQNNGSAASPTNNPGSAQSTLVASGSSQSHADSSSSASNSPGSDATSDQGKFDHSGSRHAQSDSGATASSVSDHTVNLILQQMTSFGPPDLGAASISQNNQNQNNNVQLVTVHA
jgi:hypothetical protein